MDRYSKIMLGIIAASFAVLAWRASDPPPITVQVRGCSTVTFQGRCELIEPVGVRLYGQSANDTRLQVQMEIVN